MAGESDFGDEENRGFALCEGLRGQTKVDIGLTATSDASEQTRATLSLLEALESGFLGRIKGDEGEFASLRWSGL